MMRVGLVDVDSHNFPNLVLMKLSAWHKSHGNEVELLRPADVLNGTNLFYGYDLMIGACVFDWNKPIADRLEKLGVVIGGTGSGNKDVLPEEQEHIYPDYSLYGIADTAYGFLTRGCPRHCPFCIVGDKEGLVSRKVANLSEFWSGQNEIQIMDPNILACEEHMDLLDQLAASRARVEFNQGLDARKLTRENIKMLKKIRMKLVHFAWDNPKDRSVPLALQMFAEAFDIKPKARKVGVYVLTNYWSTLEEDLERIYWLRDRGFAPYVMIYDKQNAPRKTRLLQRWVNNRAIFYSTKRFEDYDWKKG